MSATIDPSAQSAHPPVANLLVVSPSRPSTRAKAPSPTGDGAFFRALLIGAVYAIVVVVTVRAVGEPILDPDIWWHLRVGQWVVANGQVTSHDPFSLPGQDKNWVAYSWLYEVLVFGLYKLAGVAGIVVYRLLMSLLVLTAIHALVGRLTSRFLVATALTAGAALTLAPLMSERPWLFTILFATLTLHAIVEMRDQRPSRWVWLLPIAYVLWANIHIQFVYGLFLLFLALIAPPIDSRLEIGERDDTASTFRSRGWWRLVVLAGLCFLATFANPYGARLYLVIGEYASQPGPFRFVNELKAPEFREITDWLLLGLTAAACLALGRRQLTAWPVLLLAGAAFFAFRARRDLWFLLLADVYILATIRPREERDPDNASLPMKAKTLIAVGILSLALAVGWLRDLTPTGLERRIANVFPVEAANVVRGRGDTGPLYNDFNWGGYLIWALPELPVAIDGRTNLHGDERIERFGRTWCALPGWERDEDLASAGVAIAQVDSALAAALAKDVRFERVYEDRIAVVFVKR